MSWYRKHPDGGYEVLTSRATVVGITGHHVHTTWSLLTTYGVLIILPGFRWDGASGPAIDDSQTMLASAFHDVLYRMLREKRIPPPCRRGADRLYLKIMRRWAATAPWWQRPFRHARAFYHYIGVRFGARWAAKAND